MVVSKLPHARSRQFRDNLWLGATCPAGAGIGQERQNPAGMESKAKRTLVKSAPELWELASDLTRMEAWMAGIIGAREAIAVEAIAALEELLDELGSPERRPFVRT